MDPRNLATGLRRALTPVPGARPPGTAPSPLVSPARRLGGGLLLTGTFWLASVVALVQSLVAIFR